MMDRGHYRDRRDAGQVLAWHLCAQDLGDHPVVLALPRGGVPVGAEVAASLGMPLEVFLVRKLGLPGNPELAMGAIASGGIRLLDEELIARMRVPESLVADVIRQEQLELRRREEKYRPEGPLRIESQPVIVVDDGLATGFSMRAAVAALRQTGCSRITVAVPVGASETCRELAHEVDLLVCPLRPADFVAVGAWYKDFTPTSDEEVRDCLARAGRDNPRSNEEPGTWRWSHRSTPT
ncbi:MAG TPA: phosphoribosyltransferase [Lacunisphaera sp.]|nr:phosphoribosyltransferase [Lacunisphaera sp.]